MLADGQAELVLLGRQREAEHARVVRDLCPRLEGQRHKLGLLQSRRRACRCRRQHGRGCGGGRAGGRAGVGEVSDEELFELIPRLARVQRLELLGAVLPAADENGGRAARVVLEVLGRIVHLALDDDPDVVLGGVLGNLLHGEELSCLGRWLGRLDDCCPLLTKGLLFKPSTKVAWARERRVLELERRHLRLRVDDAVDLDAEVGVVHHAHHVPRDVLRLSVHRRIPATAKDLRCLALVERAQRHVELEEAPAPVPAVRRGLLRVRELRECPRLATVDRDLHADHLPPAARVAVAADRVGLLGLCERHHLQVARVRDGRIDVELVDDVIGLVPPALGVGDLGSHMLGQHAVVVVVEEVVRLVGRHCDLVEPLDHAPSDVARDDQPQWEAVIRAKTLAVLLVGEEDVACRVHRREVIDRRAISAFGHLLDADEAHMVGALLRSLNAAVLEHVTQPHALPHGRAHAGGTPVEADRLRDQILLFAPVARADECHRELS
mmetsp:Transcript_12452/g.31806  ORF Transcript_12452/g.31806 Transcript_12452/m.31806 type:complete len:495 (+) Transcript_12452:1055-2539(+)